MTTHEEDYDFDDHVRLKVLGDDNIYNISDPLLESGFNPKSIGEYMTTLGQTYTSAKKNEPLPDHCLDFDELTFLGAHPVKVNGRWSGAMKKDTLWETIQWTRDNGLSLDQTVVSMIECASQWDQEFYSNYVDSIKRAYKELNRDFPKIQPYAKLRRVVSERTANKGVLFSGLQAEGMKSEGLEDEVQPVLKKGLTAFSQSREEIKDGDSVRRRLAQLAVSQPALDLEYGLSSFVFRRTVNWGTGDAIGINVLTFTILTDLLAFGKTNLQNMPFDRYAYAEFDVEIMIQLNGTPFQQGALYCFFYPLDAVVHTFTRQVALSMPGVWLTPNENTTGIVHIPFRFWRSTLPLGSGEQLGRFYVMVIEPIISATGAQACAVSMYSRFLNAQFKLPRPYDPLVSEGVDDFISEPSSSKASHNIRGSSLPIHQSFSSMSRTIGPEATVGFLGAQQQVSEEQEGLRNMDTHIASILMKPSYIATLTWDQTQGNGDILSQIPLNSIFSYGTDAFEDLTPQLALLNEFLLFRGDFIITIRVIKTKYHSGRLFVGCAYGALGVTAADRIGYNTDVMDLNDHDMHVVTIPMTAPTEFLRTYNGLINANTTMGVLFIGVQTHLRNATTVADSVKIIVTAQIDNLKVYETRTDGFISYPTAPSNITLAEIPTMVAEAPDEPIVYDPAQADEQPTENVTLIQNRVTSDSSFIRGRKFEYLFEDVTDIMRRHRKIGINTFIRGAEVGASSSLGTLYWFSVLPSKFRNLFAAWSGTIKYRIYFACLATPSIPITFIPHQFGSDFDNADAFGFDMVPSGTKIFPPVGQATTTKFSIAQIGTFSARPTEKTFPVSDALKSNSTPASLNENLSFIDVSVPFNTNLNILSNLEVTESLEKRFPRNVGHLCFYINNPQAPTVDIYISMGEDFKYHIWRPHVGFYRIVKPTGVTLAPTIGINMNGFYVAGTNTIPP